MELRSRLAVEPAAIEAIRIRTFDAARRYPGCDFAGPFRGVVQAKMSLQYGVSAALLHGRADEAAFAAFADPDLLRLLGRCTIEVSDALKACYPGRQPVEVDVRCVDGRTVSCAVDDVPWLDAPTVEARFDQEAAEAFGETAARRIRKAVFALWETDDCRPLFQDLALQCLETRQDLCQEVTRSIR